MPISGAAARRPRTTSRRRGRGRRAAAPARRRTPTASRRPVPASASRRPDRSSVRNVTTRSGLTPRIAAATLLRQLRAADACSARTRHIDLRPGTPAAARSACASGRYSIGCCGARSAPNTASSTTPTISIDIGAGALADRGRDRAAERARAVEELPRERLVDHRDPRRRRRDRPRRYRGRRSSGDAEGAEPSRARRNSAGSCAPSRGGAMPPDDGVDRQDRNHLDRRRLIRQRRVARRPAARATAVARAFIQRQPLRRIDRGAVPVDARDQHAIAIETERPRRERR